MEIYFIRWKVEIITSRGFKAEEHYVITKDGYILGVHRIVNPQNSSKALKPILLQHGLFGSSTDFLINSPFVNSTHNHSDIRLDNNLGFLLAQEGYDVWLSNSRGNTYSKNHTKLNVKGILIIIICQPLDQRLLSYNWSLFRLNWRLILSHILFFLFSNQR